MAGRPACMRKLFVNLANDIEKLSSYLPTALESAPVNESAWVFESFRQGLHLRQLGHATMYPWLPCDRAASWTIGTGWEERRVPAELRHGGSNFATNAATIP